MPIQLQSLASGTTVTAADYQLPPCKTDFKDAVKPVFDLIIGELLGVSPIAAISLVIILALLLVIGAVSDKLRRPIFIALAAVLGAAILVGAIITMATTFIQTRC